MKRRISALLLALALVGSMLPASALAAERSPSLETIQALGIMKGDNNGNLNLSKYVTRAEFTAMLTSASSYKDTISGEGTGYSLFKDVKSSHWASEYIRLVVQEGWMVGYTDGTFRPDQNVKLEEACSAVLKLLGYDASSLAGSFPSAQLTKASALGLRDQISCQPGAAMTRQDCVELFYNLLTAQTSAGKVYATTLGYTVTNGQVDFASVTLQNLSGPYVAQSGQQLPFTPTTVYRNGSASTSAVLSLNDVYYYNEGLGTVWIYTDRASGEISGLSPSTTSPSSVSLSGSTYSIGTSTASYKLSTLGGGGVGTVVTLLLGMDGQVVDVLTGADVEMFYYGVLQSNTKVVDSSDNATVQTVIRVVCTDGVERTFTLDHSVGYDEGDLVTIGVTDSGISVQSARSTFSGGTVRTDASKVGGLSFAPDVEILDTTEEGEYVAVDPQRIAGATLTSSDVRFYVLNEDGQISHMILNDVTGDTWNYGYLISYEKQGSGMDFTTSYTYMLNGSKTTKSFSGKSYSLSSGGSGLALSYESDGSIKSMRSLSSVRLTALGVTSAQAGSQKYTLADDVQVYLKDNGSYYLTTVSAVNPTDYTLTGWYDNNGCAAGGRIRVILAQAK